MDCETTCISVKLIIKAYIGCCIGSKSCIVIALNVVHGYVINLVHHGSPAQQILSTLEFLSQPFYFQVLVFNYESLLVLKIFGFEIWF